jgi:hypothetical protein
MESRIETDARQCKPEMAPAELRLLESVALRRAEPQPPSFSPQILYICSGSPRAALGAFFLQTFYRCKAVLM